MSLITILFILFVYILYIKTFVCIYGSPQKNPELYSEEDFIYKKVGNAYQVKKPMGTIEITSNWRNQPSESHFYVYDEEFNLIKEHIGNNITLKEEIGKIYIMKEYSANFLRGGTEIRYTWFLVEIDPLSEDTITFPVDLNPALWKESPDLKW